MFPNEMLFILNQFQIHIDVKINKNLTDDRKNLFNVIQRSNEFPDSNVRNIFYEIIDNNLQLFHPWGKYSYWNIS